jgi:hypothetical protein
MGERDLAGHHRLGSAARTYGRAGCESARRTLPAELKKASARSTCQPMAVPSPGRRRRTRPDANRRIFADPLIDTYSYRKRCACAREDLETTTTARHARARSCSQPATNRALHPLMRYGRVPAAAGWPHGTCVPRQESPIDHREPRVAIRTALIGVAVTVAVDGWTPPFLSGVVRSFLHGADPSPSSASLALRSSLGASSPSS